MCSNTMCKDFYVKYDDIIYYLFIKFMINILTFIKSGIYKGILPLNSVFRILYNFKIFYIYILQYIAFINTFLGFSYLTCIE
jgi:hypothetical protein